LTDDFSGKPSELPLSMVPFPFPGPFPGFSNGMLFFFCSFLPGGVVFFQLFIFSEMKAPSEFFFWMIGNNPTTLKKRVVTLVGMKSILDVDV